MALWTGGLFNSPREKSFLVAVVVGAAGWILPALTLRKAGESPWPTVGVWSMSFLAAAFIGEMLVRRVERSGGPGFLGFVIGAGAGGAIGHFGRSISPRDDAGGFQSVARIFVSPITGFVGFIAAAYLAILGSYLGGEFVKRLLEPLWGWRPGLYLGFALGGALGGLVAGAVSIAATATSEKRAN